jgi:hypothetical protein
VTVASTIRPIGDNEATANPVNFGRHLRQLGTGERTQVGAQHDHHEKALAAPDVERVRRVRPHLRHGHDAEYAYPDEERERDRHSVVGEHRKERQRQHEEQRDGAQQSRTLEVMAQTAVHRDGDHQHEGHQRDRIGARLGREFCEHEGLAQRLHDLVRGEQQESVQEEQERGAPFARRDARDVRQQPLEPGQAKVLGCHAARACRAKPARTARTRRAA